MNLGCVMMTESIVMMMDSIVMMMDSSAYPRAAEAGLGLRDALVDADAGLLRERRVVDLHTLRLVGRDLWAAT